MWTQPVVQLVAGLDRDSGRIGPISLRRTNDVFQNAQKPLVIQKHRLRGERIFTKGMNSQPSEHSLLGKLKFHVDSNTFGDIHNYNYVFPGRRFITLFFGRHHKCLTTTTTAPPTPPPPNAPKRKKEREELRIE